MTHYEDVVRRFAAACRQGDIRSLLAELDADAVAVCDHGGGQPRTDGLVRGGVAVARLIAVLCGGPGTEVTLEAVNGRAGLAVRRAGRATAVIGFRVAEKITVLWVVLNPLKLQGWHRT
jgi:RNA polymerase sigma-70 factor (ECF subfamily)